MNINNPIYNTAADEARMMTFYEAQLQRWPIPYESLTVATRYGRTHMIASGSPDAPPIVLLHAAGANATVWWPNAAALGRHFRVYALDTLGDIGKSALEDLDHYPRDGEATSRWLADVFDELGIGRAHVIGSSMGGWLAMNHAIYAPHRLSRLVLLGPMGMPTWLATVNVLFRLTLTSLAPTRRNKESLLRWLIGDDPDFPSDIRDYLIAALDLNLKTRLAMPLRLSGASLAQIQAPTLLILGGRDRQIGNAEKAAARARRFIPHVEAEVMPENGHVMAYEDPAYVNGRILRFLGAGQDDPGPMILPVSVERVVSP